MITDILNKRYGSATIRCALEWFPMVSNGFINYWVSECMSKIDYSIILFSFKIPFCKMWQVCVVQGIITKHPKQRQTQGSDRPKRQTHFETKVYMFWYLLGCLSQKSNHIKLSLSKSPLSDIYIIMNLWENSVSPYSRKWIRNVYKMKKKLVDHANIYIHCFSIERRKYYKHCLKARTCPEKYVSIIIDGMDQAKSYIPHFLQKSKSREAMWKLKIHVTGY